MWGWRLLRALNPSHAVLNPSHAVMSPASDEHQDSENLVAKIQRSATNAWCNTVGPAPTAKTNSKMKLKQIRSVAPAMPNARSGF
jgi:hypothetical protein